MKKTTRKSFSRKAIIVIASVFLVISLTATGFAAWLISNDADANKDGNVTVSDISDQILGVTIDTATPEKINFGPANGDTTGNIQYVSTNAEDVESLKVTVKGTVKNFNTMKEMEVSIKVPDSVIKAAGYKLNEDGNTYSEDVSLPKYIELPAGAQDSKGNYIVSGSKVVYTEESKIGEKPVFTVSATEATFEFVIEFRWGALFENENPSLYLDGEVSGKTIDETELAKLLAVANAGKAVENQYKKLTAEAKRDILQSMKTLLETGENKYTIVVNAAAKK